MSPTDRRTLAWLAPLALLLAAWWSQRLNPCLGTEFGNAWRRWFPPPAPVEPTAIVNPYGIETCHHWPTAGDQLVTLLLLALFASLVGFLGARLQSHPVRRSFLIMGAAMLVVMVTLQLVSLPALVGDGGSNYWNRIAALEAGMGLAIVLVTGLQSALAAWLTLRWRAAAA